MADVPIDTLVATRRSLHQVAEHVLSAALKRATGAITLRPGVGGFRTPPVAGRVLAVIGTDMAVVVGDDVRRSPLTTVRAAAAFAATEPGFPWTKHPPGTDFEPDRPLLVDDAAARLLADWYGVGNQALHQIATELAPGDLPEPQIFPEHFDLGITVADVNYGFSPGDDPIPTPYAYVGPFGGPPSEDSFWNAPFGAYRTVDDVSSVADAVAFLQRGHELVGRG